MNLKTRKRISTLKQYYEIENKIKDAAEGIIFWAVFMLITGNSYLN